MGKRKRGGSRRPAHLRLFQCPQPKPGPRPSYFGAKRRAEEVQRAFMAYYDDAVQMRGLLR